MWQCVWAEVKTDGCGLWRAIVMLSLVLAGSTPMASRDLTISTPTRRWWTSTWASSTGGQWGGRSFSSRNPRWRRTWQVPKNALLIWSFGNTRVTQTNLFGKWRDLCVKVFPVNTERRSGWRPVAPSRKWRVSLVITSLCWPWSPTPSWRKPSTQVGRSCQFILQTPPEPPALQVSSLNRHASDLSWQRLLPEPCWGGPAEGAAQRPAGVRTPQSGRGILSGEESSSSVRPKGSDVTCYSEFKLTG